MKPGYLLACCLAVGALYACGHPAGSGTDANGNGDGGLNGVNDSGMLTGNGDAPFTGGCTAGGAQCSNCIDDDHDGKIDGFDPECTGPADNDEASFATGIPGDNIDSTMQDCFFDGNSGGGDDKCNQHTCCLLQAGTQPGTTQQDRNICHQEAPLANQNKYTIANCYAPWGTTPVPAQCVSACAPLSPPGCDCFGCCTVCNGTGCYTIEINPSVSPGCNDTNLQDATICKRCVQSTTCTGGTCGGDTCVLCPGQDPSSLPTSCNGTNACPSGIDPCAADGTCGQGLYCSNGCCIGVIL